MEKGRHEDYGGRGDGVIRGLCRLRRRGRLGGSMVGSSQQQCKG